jgi:hypothetical protein
MVDVVQWAEAHRGAGVVGLPFYDELSIICRTEKKKTKKDRTRIRERRKEGNES